MPKGCRLFLFQILHSEKKIFSRYFGNWGDSNSPLLRFQGQNLKKRPFCGRRIEQSFLKISYDLSGVCLLVLSKPSNRRPFSFHNLIRQPAGAFLGCSGLFEDPSTPPQNSLRTAEKPTQTAISAPSFGEALSLTFPADRPSGGMSRGAECY